MKKSVLMLLLVLMCAACAVNVFAAEPVDYVVDNAELLTNYEEAELTAELETLSREYQVDVAVVTMESIGYEDPDDFAESYFLSNGYGQGEYDDGILLLISMQYRDWAIYTSGVGYDAVSNSDASDIGELIASDLGSGDYADAFHTFAEECAYYLDIEENGEPFPFVRILLVSLAIGIVAAFIVTAILKGQLHSVHSKASASDYLKPGSLNVTVSKDLFLYSKVDRRPKPKSSSSSSSRSSGRRSGGSSGKF